MENVQMKLVSESKQSLEQTLDILKLVFPLHIESKIMPNDRDMGYHCLLTVQPTQSKVK